MDQKIHTTDFEAGFWRKRYTMVVLCAFATFICYADRVNISVAIIPMAADLSWGAETQGRILSAFFVGYFLTQIVGGWLADRFGGKVILGIGVLWWSLFTLLTPPAAALGLTVLLVSRIAMGMGEAVSFPAVYSLVGRWMPVAERSRAIGLNNSCVPLGTVFALLVTPIIVGAWGWEWAFYSFGAVGFLWFLLWQPLVAASPEKHKGLSDLERREIEAQVPGESPDPAPTLTDLLKRRAVWAIIVAHFCNNWSLYVLLSWLPTFVNKGLGVDFASVGVLTMLPHICSFFAMNYAGRVADKMISRGADVTRVRKTMQTIGFGGLFIAFMLVGEVESVAAAIIIMCLGMTVGAFVTGGFLVNHMDIAPRHAGKLMGITNTAGTIPGVIGVYISGVILEVTNSWILVFQVAAGVTLFGLIFYLMFASSKKLY